MVDDSLDVKCLVGNAFAAYNHWTGYNWMVGITTEHPDKPWNYSLLVEAQWPGISCRGNLEGNYGWSLVFERAEKGRKGFEENLGSRIYNEPLPSFSVMIFSVMIEPFH